jgi:hypothetical protein
MRISLQENHVKYENYGNCQIGGADRLSLPKSRLPQQSARLIDRLMQFMNGASLIGAQDVTFTVRRSAFGGRRGKPNVPVCSTKKKHSEKLRPRDTVNGEHTR